MLHEDGTWTNGNSRKRSKPEVDPLMELTMEELQWARQLKDAFKQDREILACTFSDMQIAAFAIVDRGDVERSLARGQCLQAFRMQYNINDNVTEAIEIFRRHQEICPGLTLSLDECPNDDGKGAYVWILDIAKYFPLRFLQHPKDFRYHIGWAYYMIKCMQPDLKSVRDGFRQVFECDGSGWQNFAIKVEVKLVDELLSSLPYRRGQVKCLRISPIALVFHALLRPFMPKEEHEAFSFGSEHFQTEFPDRIDQFYSQPSPEVAFETLMTRCQNFLKRRIQNEQSFRLDDR
jgi:CRAL/TRIO domain